MSDKTGRALGTLRPIVYFENRKSERHPPGYVMLSPETDTPKQYVPEGFEVMEAGTLADVTKLQKKLYEQEMLERDIELETYKLQNKDAREEKRKSLVERMLSPDTSEHDRKFIEAYLQVREDRREKYEKRFSERTAYLNILAYDESKAQQEIIDKVMAQ